MVERDSIRDIFFEECEDLLQDLQEGLQALDDGSADDECINAIFRAVHSVKGGAGAFGLEELVGFAHVFETVLDEMRGGAITPDAELLQLLLRAGDSLSDFVEAARNGDPADTSKSSSLLEQLEAVLGDRVPEEEEFAFESVRLNLEFGDDLGDGLDQPLPELSDQMFEVAPPLPLLTWTIKFAPTDDLFEMGHEPLVLFRALAELGEVEIAADTSKIPLTASFDWQKNYLSWTVSLITDVSRDEIMEVFEFVEGFGTLEITSDSTENTAGLASIAQLESDTDPLEKAHTESKNSEKADPSQTAVKTGRRVPPATLRVEVDRIDKLVNTVGELIINQAMLSQRIREMRQQPEPELLADLEDYKQLASEVQEGIMDLRMQPIQQLFQRMNRIVRETANTAGKFVTLELQGEETKVDKKVIEKLADPLTHMVRNAIDHGLESPDKRLQIGKPEKGTVRLNASHKSGNVLIQIIDDGGGLNRARIRQTAEEKGLISKDDHLTEAEVDMLLFRPGFSTASTVTSLSGRGVGMDVVKTAITGLGGRILIESKPGTGSVFTIILPLTLAVLEGMVISIEKENMVVPIAAVEEAVRPKKTDIRQLGSGGLVFENRGDFLPVIDLGEFLGLAPSNKKLTKRTLLLLRCEDTAVALAVDRVLGKRQVVIKSLAKNYKSVPGVSAATILGDGKVALIIDPDAIAPEVRKRPSTTQVSNTDNEAQNAA